MKKSNLMPLSVTIAALAAAGGALVGILTLRQKTEERRALKALHKEEEEEETEIDITNTVTDDFTADDEETLEELSETQEEKEDDRL